MRPRGFLQMRFEARPLDGDLFDKHGTWTATAFIAGHSDDIHLILGDWLKEQGMEPGRYLSRVELRKAKGREGPAVVAIEDQSWPFIDEDVF